MNLKSEMPHPVNKESVHFTYHKQTGYIGLVWAMVAVTLFETVGVSFFLYQWNPVVHWIHLTLGIAVIVFLLADLKAVLKYPITVNDDRLSLKIGIRPSVTIMINHIKEIKNGNIHYENDRKSKEVLDLSLLGFDGPSFEIVLETPIENKTLFGKSRSVKRIYFTVDDKSFFQTMIKERQGLAI